MKKRLVFSVLGKFLIIEAILLLLPALCSLIYKEYNGMVSFLVSAAISAAVGFIMWIQYPKRSDLYAKEGLLIIACVWVLWSLIGALPFFISGEINSYIDSFFETVSGFTTTGATILTDIEAMSRGMLFWRSFTHWIGGMGVLVFVMAIIPLSDKNSIHLMRAEVPGPVVSKLVPKGMRNAKILYGIYISLCIVEFILLTAGGMPVFDSIIHTFSTAGTGGFSCKNASITAYGRRYMERGITLFMFLISINFNIYFFMIMRKFIAVKNNSEWKLFTIIVIVATALLTLSTANQDTNIGDTIRTAAFQTVSIISTTGFGTADFNLWSGFAKIIILVLMVIGACAGSTGGGLKVSRIIIMFKSVRKTLHSLVSPNSINNIKVDGKLVDDDTVRATSAYVVIYVIVFIIAIILLSINNLSVEETIASVTSCFNNVGPALGITGPVGNYSTLTDFSKIILSLTMLLGRLELFPILIMFVPALWRKKFV